MHIFGTNASIFIDFEYDILCLAYSDLCTKKLSMKYQSNSKSAKIEKMYICPN